MNLQQELFCENYIIDYNGTKAAIRAGYSEKTAYSQANKLLKKGEILDHIRELQAELIKQLGISADWVLQQLISVLNRCMQAEAVMEWDAKKQVMVETGEYTFNVSGALKSLELIGKYLGMYDGKPQKVQLSASDNLYDAIAEAIKK